jgi:hypothetical protein
MNLRLLKANSDGGVSSVARMATGFFSSRSGTLALQDGVMTFTSHEQTILQAKVAELQSVKWTSDGVRFQIAGKSYRFSFSVGSLVQHPVSAVGNARELRNEWRQVIEASLAATSG